MRCNACNIEINCKTNECPLCHASLINSESDRKAVQKLERAFPTRKGSRGLAASPFTLVSLILFANIFILSVTLNAVLTPKLYWSIIVISCMVYLYSFVKGSILRSKRFHARVVANAVALFVLFIIAQNVIGENLLIYEYILPSLAIISILVLAIYILINIKAANQFLFSLFVLAMFAVIPIFFVIATDSPIIWPALVVAILGGSLIAFSLIAGFKIIISNIKRIFHQ